MHSIRCKRIGLFLSGHVAVKRNFPFLNEENAISTYIYIIHTFGLVDKLKCVVAYHPPKDVCGSVVVVFGAVWDVWVPQVPLEGLELPYVKDDQDEDEEPAEEGQKAHRETR